MSSFFFLLFSLVALPAFAGAVDVTATQQMIIDVVPPVVTVGVSVLGIHWAIQAFHHLREALGYSNSEESFEEKYANGTAVEGVDFTSFPRSYEEIVAGSAWAADGFHKPSAIEDGFPDDFQDTVSDVSGPFDVANFDTYTPAVFAAYELGHSGKNDLDFEANFTPEQEAAFDAGFDQGFAERHPPDEMRMPVLGSGWSNADSEAEFDKGFAERHPPDEIRMPVLGSGWK